MQLAPDLRLPPSERLSSGLGAYLTFVEAHAGAYVALMRSGTFADPEVLEIVETSRAAISTASRKRGSVSQGPARSFGSQ